MNSIFIIQAYKVGNTWAFDDLKRGISQEPFVGGFPNIIRKIMLEKIGKIVDNFTITFSDNKFPGSDICLNKQNDLNGGSWYKLSGTDIEGWLCPALRKYYTESLPNDLYLEIDFE